MIIDSFSKERVTHHLLSGSPEAASRVFRVPQIRPEHVDQLFGIKGLLETITSSSHWARWRVVVVEGNRPVEGNGDQVALDLDVGNDEKKVGIRYYPRLLDKGKVQPRQFSGFSVDGNYQDPRILEKGIRGARVKQCRIEGKSIIFTVIPPEGGRRTLRVYPEGDGYAASFGSSSEKRPVTMKRQPRQLSFLK